MNEKLHEGVNVEGLMSNNGRMKRLFNHRVKSQHNSVSEMYKFYSVYKLSLS